MKLSILIAAYNVEKFIKKCINSCFDEQYAHLYEIIVVNDGSTDNTLKIINALLPQISNLKIINQENRGLGAARNTGIENACGEYIWMIDGDDFLESKIIETLLGDLKIGADCYGLNYNVVSENHELIYVKYPQNHIHSNLTGIEYYSKYLQNSYTWQYIFKKQIFIENNLRFRERINMQDSEILPKIMFHVTNFLYINKIAYNYVQQKNSFTNSSNPNKRKKYFQSIIEVDNSLEKFGNEIRNISTELYNAIQIKRKSLHMIIFNHLVFFKYDSKTLKEVLNILKQNNFYPLQYNPRDLKKKILRIIININPIFSKVIIDALRK